MLMGFHLSTLQRVEDLTPRNPYNDEHWAFPPTIILRTMSDEADVIVRVNSTAAALKAQVCSARFACIVTSYSLCLELQHTAERHTFPTLTSTFLPSSTSALPPMGRMSLPE